MHIPLHYEDFTENKYWVKLECEQYYNKLMYNHLCL